MLEPQEKLANMIFVVGTGMVLSEYFTPCKFARDDPWIPNPRLIYKEDIADQTLLLDYVFAGLFHPARRVRQPYWRLYNSAYVQVSLSLFEIALPLKELLIVWITERRFDGSVLPEAGRREDEQTRTCNRLVGKLFDG